jgi:hypothetical protein
MSIRGHLSSLLTLENQAVIYSWLSMHACGTTCAVPHETASCLEELKRTLLVRCELAAMTASSMRRPEFKKFKLRYRVQCTAGPSDYTANPI